MAMSRDEQLSEKIYAAFMEAYDELGSDQMEKMLQLSQPSISALKTRRQRLTTKALRILCNARNLDTLWLEYQLWEGQRHLQRRKQSQEKVDELSRKIGNLNPRQVRILEQLVDLFHQENLLERIEMRVRNTFAQAAEQLKDKPLPMNTIDLLLQANCRFGMEWISARTGYPQDFLQLVCKKQAKLPDDAAKLIATYNLAHDLAVKQERERR